MSVFKVKLNNVNQGRLDLDPTTNTSGTYGQLGSAFTTSKQRQIYVAGPRKTYRLLSDGETFTDCNYWLRFTADEVGYENSFIEVISDDGSVYSDVEEENTFTIGATLTLSTSYTTDNTVDFVTDHGGPARFLTVQNLDGTNAVVGQLNADANITFRLAAGETMIFNNGDMQITMLKLKSSAGTPSASYIASVKSTPTS